ncbi:hypothetical protein [Pseudomonas sp. RL]|uniref:hypothetical protein n=1 Tax=Pseudomonas sp. RL TaxID=1452718 RepID=UPI001C475031|nr:hypothetical protein [Pseudomonas sp. RL]
MHVIGMLAFGDFIYAGMYKAPDDPYGISDIIELFLACLFMFFLVLSVFYLSRCFLKGECKARSLQFSLWCFAFFLLSASRPFANLRLGGVVK